MKFAVGHHVRRMNKQPNIMKYYRIPFAFIVFLLIVLIPVVCVIWISSRVTAPQPKEFTEMIQLRHATNTCELVCFDIKLYDLDTYYQLRGKWLRPSELFEIRKRVMGDEYYEIDYFEYFDGVEVRLEPERNTVHARVVR